MSDSPAPPPKRWATFELHGRRFFRFPLQVRNRRRIPFTVACRIAHRYSVRNVLARGGGGVILVASDLRTRNPVLIKAAAEYDTRRFDLSEPLEGIVDAVRRVRHHLQTERRLLVQLRNLGCHAVPHPNDYVYDANPALEGPHQAESRQIWKLDDPELLKSEPYLVMQHVAGTSLKDLMEADYQRGLPETTALRIIGQVARVLELLQRPIELANGQTWQLVYQDLKPGNILVDKYGRATVIDFGGCQMVIDGTLVLHGSHSPGHCAPECGQQDEPITPAADTYSLGTTLYQMLTGIDPRRLLPRKIESGAPRAVRLDTSVLAGRCSPQVVELVDRCVDWDPPRRFANAAEFRLALESLLSSADGGAGAS